MNMDVVIFGGGAAGLWLLDDLTRRGYDSVLIEAHTLGAGQTVASQGIIHGGLKYTLSGLLTDSAVSIREMPAVWRDCLNGEREPNLGGVRRRADSCFLWRTDSWSSRLGMLGAQIGLRVTPESVAEADRPDVLRGCPGQVTRLPEQVVSPASLIELLARRNSERLLKAECNGISVNGPKPGEVTSIELRDGAQRLELRPRQVVFAAGAGNAELRRSAGLTTESMQRRPLHMVMLRGALPMFQGHCVDGAATRVTITSDSDSAGRVVWQVGGQIAESGVAWDERTLLANARAELRSVLPSLDLTGVEWSTYRVDRAEGRMPGGRRPDNVQILRDGNCFTVWPTKLALVPQLAHDLAEQLCREHGPSALTVRNRDPFDWPRPTVARPPWELNANWLADADVAAIDRHRAAKAA